MDRHNHPRDFALARGLINPDGKIRSEEAIIEGIKSYDNRGVGRVSHGYFKKWAAAYIKNEGPDLKSATFIQSVPLASRQDNVKLIQLLKHFPKFKNHSIVEFSKPGELPITSLDIFFCRAQFVYRDASNQQRIVLFQTHEKYEDKGVKYGFVAAMARIAFCKDSLRNAQIQIIDCGKPQGQKIRRLTPIDEADLFHFSTDEVWSALNAYHIAKQYLYRSGYRPKPTGARGQGGSSSQGSLDL